MRRAKIKVQARELVSAAWIVLVTFLIGIPIVFIDYKDHDYIKEILLFLYLFLEFLPMVLYMLAILLPSLSPHLLLPWVLINSLLLLISSILALSLSMAAPTLSKVVLALSISILLIFPVLLAITMFLPLVVYLKKLVPNYKKQIRRSHCYRKITGTKTAEEIEDEIKQRRREQIMNTVITDKDFEQFIYVNRAAKKWKAKLKKKQPPQDELKDILDEGNITVNQSYELDMLKHRQEAQEAQEVHRNGDLQMFSSDRQPLLTNGDVTVAATTVCDNGKFVTDV